MATIESELNIANYWIDEIQSKPSGNYCSINNIKSRGIPKVWQIICVYNFIGHSKEGHVRSEFNRCGKLTCPIFREAVEKASDSPWNMGPTEESFRRIHIV